jgi:hypothetical protein
MLNGALQPLLLSYLTTFALVGAADPFVGEWRLDRSRSILIDQMSVAAAGPNKYTLVLSVTGAETVVADGTDQPGLFGTAMSINVEAPNSWKVVRKKDGRTLLTGEWKLSEDGKILRDHYTEYGADGSAHSTDYVYTRTAGSSGFIGTWENTSEPPSAFEVRIQRWKNDGLSFVPGNAHKTQNLRFDGKDYPETGSDVLSGSTSSGRRLNERALEITEKIDGRATNRRRITLSPDLRTLTMAVYPTGRSKPNILVFDRE